jgi:hypothetical protein
MNGFYAAEKEMAIFKETHQAHDANYSEYPYYLKVLLCKKDWYDGSQIDQ